MYLSLDPIGSFSTEKKKHYQTPLQPTADSGTSGVITLKSNLNYEQALDDLEGFERIWVIFWFHENDGWRPKVLPPRYDKKVGVFATRSPHRPNPIGISCVKLTKIDGRKIYIEDHDLLDATPVYDIKPYVPYADSYPHAATGWLKEIPAPMQIEVGNECAASFAWVKEHSGLDILADVLAILKKKAYPSPSNRIKQIDKQTHVLAFKSWRVTYSMQDEQNKILLTSLQSGYLNDIPLEQRGDDYALHQEFLKRS